jgi:flagellar biosynthetic protein FlhB
MIRTGLFLVLLTFSIHMVTTQGGWALAKLSPDFGRLSPMKRMEQVRRQNGPAFLQALILLPVFSYIVFLVLRSNTAELLRLPLSGVEQGMAAVGHAISRLLWQAALCFLAFGLFDFVRQQRRHRNDLMMTKQEVREESKESEGNPQMKQRIRRLQRDAARRNMMREVPKATAIIVNPTHYSVAIRYVAESMAAPTVVAKGKNYLALRIREKAREHNVPIVENVALAQALYKSADVGQEIPAHLYRAVAEVLAYIFRLMKGNLPGRV